MFKLCDMLQYQSPWILGVLNITPNSFSDGGKFLHASDALAQAQVLLDGGAHIIDIGAESTAPSRQPITAEEEIDRLSQVIDVLGKRYFVSIDTYKAPTAEYCLQRGARMINDVSCFRADCNMVSVVRDYRCLVVMMYSKEGGQLPHVTLVDRVYTDVIQDISNFFEERLNYAFSRGINEDQVILDPGMGAFVSIRPQVSWDLLQRLDELVLRFSKFPFFIGTSRKSIFDNPLEDRDPLSQLTALGAWLKGVQFIRTHNPKMMSEFLSCWNRMFRTKVAIS